MRSPLIACSYVRLSKAEQATPESKASHAFQIDKAVAELGVILPDEYRFFDNMSGRRADRPDFNKAIALVKSKKVDIVIGRSDRLARDVGISDRFCKAVEQAGVKLFDLLKWRLLDFSNPDDWEAFMQSSLRSDGESRVLSRRIKLRNEFNRSQGKAHAGKPPYGFIRNKQGFYEPDPGHWDKLLRMIAICDECDYSTVTAARLIYQELGIKKTYQTLHKMLLNPAYRGHTAHYPKDRDKKRRQPDLIIPSTHQAAISPEQAAKIDQALVLSAKRRGRKQRSNIIPLADMLYCGRCGERSYVSSCRKGDRVWYRVYCTSYRQGHGCGNPVKGKASPAKRGTAGVKYGLVEAAVILALCDRAADIVNQASVVVTEFQDTEETLRLRQQIAELTRMANDIPELLPTLQKKQGELTALIQASEGNFGLRHSQDYLITKGNDPLFWHRATPAEKIVLYREFVQRVEVTPSDDPNEPIITVKLLV